MKLCLGKCLFATLNYSFIIYSYLLFVLAMHELQKLPTPSGHSLLVVSYCCPSPYQSGASLILMVAVMFLILHFKSNWLEMQTL